MKRQRNQQDLSPAHAEPIVQLWTLRALVKLSGHQAFIRSHGFHDDALAQALGLGRWIDPPDGEFKVTSVQTELRRLHQKTEQQCAQAMVADSLRANVAQLAELVGLSQTDCRILEFVVTVKNERLLDEALDCIGELSSVRVAHALAVLLGLPTEAIGASLSAHGALSRSGLVALDRDRRSPLGSKLELLSNGFAEAMLTPQADPIDLLRGTVAAAAPGHLHLADFAHIAPALEILKPYLQRVTASTRRGVNIFLHGAPGTGKSQLARTLAQALNCALFEIASEDADGDPVGGACRLRAFRVAQSFFAKRQALIVFDEVDDVFNDGFSLFGRKSTAQLHKGWINRTLEENPVPTLWLSNHVHTLDPAFIRRFDMVIELPVPPKRQRARIIEQSCGELLDADSISRIAEAETLAPAVVTRAASVVLTIQDTLSPKAAAEALERLISNTLEAQGHRPLLRHDPNRLPEVYDPMFIHADADLAAVAAGMIKARSGRMCLYGPPGTGKTAYGRWLAQQLDAPLLVKRASDLLSPYVGECEINIARAFRDAQSAGALLMIDEIDGFLKDRRDAQRAWEISQVNEMLTQIESFAGVFIASTNLVEGLDQAALRRFDLKVKFDFLKSEQAAELLRRHCANLALAPPPADALVMLARLKHLTPGDFAAVLRQHRFRPLISSAAMVVALAAECAIKNSPKASIGFI